MHKIDFERALRDLDIVHKNPIARMLIPFSFGTYEECKTLFIEAFCIVDKTFQKFIYLPEYNHIIEWMVDTKGKGLFLMGECGRGKSIIVTGVIPLIFLVKHHKVVRQFQAEDIPSKIEQIVTSPFLVIDDLGVEPRVNNFGNNYDGFVRIIGIAESKIKPLFISTNLTGEELINRYGERSIDRIKRLCKIIQFKGESLRQ